MLTPTISRALQYIRPAMKQPDSKPPTPLEVWRCDAGSDSIAVLNIPGLNGRARVFDVDATLLVNVPADPEGAWLELMVEVDGKRQWNRRIPAHNPGQTDGLDYHQRLRLEAEQGVRVRAVAKVKGLRVRQLLLEAREDI